MRKFDEIYHLALKEKKEVQLATNEINALLRTQSSRALNPAERKSLQEVGKKLPASIRIVQQLESKMAQALAGDPSLSKAGIRLSEKDALEVVRFLELAQIGGTQKSIRRIVEEVVGNFQNLKELFGQNESLFPSGKFDEASRYSRLFNSAVRIKAMRLAYQIEDSRESAGFDIKLSNVIRNWDETEENFRRMNSYETLNASSTLPLNFKDTVLLINTNFELANNGAFLVHSSTLGARRFKAAKAQFFDQVLESSNLSDYARKEILGRFKNDLDTLDGAGQPSFIDAIVISGRRQTLLPLQRMETYAYVHVNDARVEQDLKKLEREKLNAAQKISDEFLSVMAETVEEEREWYKSTEFDVEK